jgi:hypothetical protein
MPSALCCSRRLVALPACGSDEQKLRVLGSVARRQRGRYCTATGIVTVVSSKASLRIVMRSDHCPVIVTMAGVLR